MNVNTSIEKIKEITALQRNFFATGATIPIKYRKEQLKKLNDALAKWENAICEALWNDWRLGTSDMLLLLVTGAED